VPAACRKFAEENKGAFVEHTIRTVYSDYTYDEALTRLLPAGVEVPASFETIGHVAHLNLRPPQEPYRLLIAQVMVDKYPAIKVVVHKTGSITNEFRVFSMEVIADKMSRGAVPRIAAAEDASLDTVVKQAGCTFALNFADVYWNSRLGSHPSAHSPNPSLKRPKTPKS
jgi:tRNA (guanine37-N1)-methyltransferase